MNYFFKTMFALTEYNFVNFFRSCNKFFLSACNFFITLPTELITNVCQRGSISLLPNTFQGRIFPNGYSLPMALYEGWRSLLPLCSRSETCFCHRRLVNSSYSRWFNITSTLDSVNQNFHIRFYESFVLSYNDENYLRKWIGLRRSLHSIGTHRWGLFSVICEFTPEKHNQQVAQSYIRIIIGTKFVIYLRSRV